MRRNWILWVILATISATCFVAAGQATAPAKASFQREGFRFAAQRAGDGRFLRRE